MSCRTFLAIFVLAVAAAQAQAPKINLGLTAGFPVKTVFPNSDSLRFTIGPRVDLSFAEHFVVTINPLYQRTGTSFGPFRLPPEFDPSQIQGPLFTRSDVRIHSVELPVIGNYHFGSSHRTWRPFAGAGFSLRGSRTKSSNELLFFDPPGATQRTEIHKSSSYSGDAGAAAAAGVSIRVGRFTLIPEVRFTYWGPNYNGGNQTDALLSIRF